MASFTSNFENADAILFHFKIGQSKRARDSVFALKVVIVLRASILSNEVLCAQLFRKRHRKNGVREWNQKKQSKMKRKKKQIYIIWNKITRNKFRWKSLLFFLSVRSVSFEWNLLPSRAYVEIRFFLSTK